MWKKQRGRRLPFRSFSEEGREAEEAFFKAMTFFRGSYPHWLKQITKAPEYLDAQRVDALVKVAGDGTLYVQIKSTVKGKQFFEKQNSGILCILVQVNERAEVIYERAIKLLQEEYRGFIENQRVLTPSTFHAAV